MTTPRRLRRPQAKRLDSDEIFLSSLHRTWAPSAVSVCGDGMHYATSVPSYHECDLGEWRQMCHCGRMVHGTSPSEAIRSMLRHVVTDDVEPLRAPLTTPEKWLR